MVDNNSKFSDISHWPAGQPMSIPGAREKEFYNEPESKTPYFIKYPDKDRADNIRIQETITEYVATELAKSWDIPAHECFPGIRDNKLGLVAKLLFVGDKQFVEARQMFPAMFPGSYNFATNVPRKDFYKLHNIDTILKVFLRHLKHYPFSSFETSFLPGFSKMLLFDAVVGNTDRHWQNYGLIKELRIINTEPLLNPKRGLLTKLLNELVIRTINVVHTGKFELTKEIQLTKIIYSPLFDNTSCLFWQLEDSKIPTTDEELKKFALFRPSSSISLPKKPKVNHLELLRHVKDGVTVPGSVSSTLKTLLIDDFKAFQTLYHIDKVYKIIESSHFGTFSTQRIELICRYIDIRFHLIKEILEQ